MRIIVLVFLVFCSLSELESQTVLGIWESYHPHDKSPIARIEVYEEDNRAFARVLSILDESLPNFCEHCIGEDKNRPIVGMDVIWELKKKNDKYYKKGQILDPSNGRKYKCYLKLENDDLLKVRAYSGIKALGKTQFWSRIYSVETIVASK